MGTSRIWKRLLAFGILAALLFGIPLILLHQKAAASIRRHEVAVATLLSELQVGASPRTPIFGPPLPDRGWDLYVEAAGLIHNIEAQELSEIPELAFALGDPDHTEIASVWAKYAPVVEVLRRAVRCADQSRDPDRRWPNDSLELSWVTKFLIGGSAYLHQLGDDRGAFDLLTLYIAVCRDTLGRISGGAGWSPESDVTAASIGLKFLATSSLQAGDLEELAARLDQLAEVRPSTAREYRLRDALERRRALEGTRQEWEGSTPLEAGWRHLFLPAVAKATALAEIEQAYRDFADVERRPPLEREEAAEGLGPPWRRGRAPGTCIVSSNNLHYREVSALEALSMMRIGVALAWYRAEKGAPAERLQDLVPRYLPEVPPQYSGKYPWTYEPETSTLRGIYDRVWSIGQPGD